MTSDIIRERGRSQRLSRRKLQVVADGGAVDPVMMAKKATKKARTPREPKTPKAPKAPKVPFDQMPDWWQRLRAAVLKRKDELQREANLKGTKAPSLNAMSLAAVGEKSYISNMFTQRKIPQVDYFLKVCDAVEANPAYILWGVDMSREAVRAAQMLGLNNPQRREALLKWLESWPLREPRDQE